MKLKKNYIHLPTHMHEHHIEDVLDGGLVGEGAGALGRPPPLLNGGAPERVAGRILAAVVGYHGHRTYNLIFIWNK